jgi:hypothetical protein
MVWRYRISIILEDVHDLARPQHRQFFASEKAKMSQGNLACGAHRSALSGAECEGCPARVEKLIFVGCNEV